MARRARRGWRRRRREHHRGDRHLGEEDVLRRRRPQGADRGTARTTPRRCSRRHPDQGPAAPAGDPRPAGRGRDERHRARRRAWRSRWPATTASGWTRRASVRAARGDPRPAARRRRRRPRSPACSASRTALMNVLVQGQRHKPAAGAGGRDRRRAGHHPGGAARPAARVDRRATPRPRQPWDGPGYRIPGGTPVDAEARRRSCRRSRPTCASSSRARPMPAPRNILAAAVEGAQVDFDTALRIESRYFVELVTGQVAKNMTKAFFFDLQAIAERRLAARRVRAVDAPRRVGRARRRHDGRRHRLRVRQGGLGGRAQGRLAGGRREGQGVLARSWSTRPCSAGGPRRRSATRSSPGSPRPTTTPTWPAATS